MNSIEMQFKRHVSDWFLIAKEEITIELIRDTYYAFGSELATLRLLAHYRYNDLANAGYSQNLTSFYFRLETV